MLKLMGVLEMELVKDWRQLLTYFKKGVKNKIKISLGGKTKTKNLDRCASNTL